MEFKSGSELEVVHGSRQEQIVRGQEHRAGLSDAEVPVWSQAWLDAWPRAKTVALPGVGLCTQAAANAWIEAEWAEAKARRYRRQVDKQRSRTWAEAEALALAGVWAWAARPVQGEAQNGDCAPSSSSGPSGLADPSTIIDILTSLNRYGVANDLWHCSPEKRDEYSCIIHFIAPITRLPFELLHHIFLIIIDETHGQPPALMLVCKDWHVIVTSIWASLNLGTTTSIDAVTSKLERSKWLLDIAVDTDSDRGDFTPSDTAFEAIFAAIEATPRWRSFVVKSFPARADLPEEIVNRRLQHCSNATMSRFATFKIKPACETSPLLDGLLRILGTLGGSELTTVEINSGNVISYLAPLYLSLFHSVKVLSLDTWGIRDPVDLLPHLHQLESFTASYLPLSVHHGHVELPFVHTLRHLRLKSVSIQWMSGRTFHVLETCTLIFPLHQQALPAFNTTLPNCNHLTFQGHPLEILGGISAQHLSHLSVTCSGSFNRRGTRHLVWLSCQVLGESRLAPKSLHISIKATSEAWIESLALMSDLEELVIHSARPSSIGAKVFQSLVQPVHVSNLGTTPAPGELGGLLCPSLRRFGLKYDRWLRRSEQFDLIPVFVSIIRSREYSNYSLESFDLWTTNDQEDPLELIESSQVSVEGFKRLAKESGIKEGSLDLATMRLTQVTPGPSQGTFLVAPLPADDPSPRGGENIECVLHSTFVQYSQELDSINPVPPVKEEAVPAIHATSPRRGPMSGGTEIRLTGENFPTASALYLRFGTVVTATVSPIFHLQS